MSTELLGRRYQVISDAQPASHIGLSFEQQISLYPMIPSNAKRDTPLKTKSLQTSLFQFSPRHTGHDLLI